MTSINDSSFPIPIKMSENNECCISEESLTEEIGKKMVEGAEKTQSKSSSSCIYRVPKVIRNLKESEYTPRFVSIGPLHSKDQHILNLSVQNLKRSYANTLFGRISSKEGGTEEERRNKYKEVLMECVRKMRKSLDKAQKCYAEEVEDVLTEEMLVIDACFILEILYKFTNNKQFDDGSDPILGNILMPIYVQHDLLLFENQLPFFVLNELFDLTLARIAGMPLHEYVTSSFDDIWESKKKSKKNGTTTTTKTKSKDYNHVLHFLHNHYRPRNAHPGYAFRAVAMPCASDLKYAGIMFEKGTDVMFKSRGPFHRAKFQLPTFYLLDLTEPFLRNLIAYEHCCPGVPGYFTSYVILMDTLIKTPKDVEVLEKAGIICNCLGPSEDASDLFKNLCKEIVLGEYYFMAPTAAAAEYSQQCWPDALSHLRRKYFSNPWSFVVFGTGFITFSMSVYQFFRRNIFK